MATNPFFNNFNFTGEQSLIDSLVIESIKMYGHDMYYMPRTMNSFDDMMNEDDLPSYETAYLIEMYIKNVEGFEGEGDFLSKFGLQIRDSATFTISRTVFNDIIGFQEDIARPHEGALLYFPLNDKTFKIMSVEHEAVFYQTGALQTYDLQCELFEYSQEVFSTGIPAIDDQFKGYDLTPNTAIEDPDSVLEFADNSTIQVESDLVIDFSEEDPYSEGGRY